MKHKIYLLTFLFALTLVSCDDFLDVNTDPNNPVEVSPDLTLPVAQVFTAQVMQSQDAINHLGNMMMFNWGESFGFSWYDEHFQYLVTSTFFDECWDISYRDCLKEYHDLIGLDAEFANYSAIAEIMKAYHYQLLVDIYGDIPYTEALQRGENATPVYNDSETIYQDLIVKLTDAIDSIKVAADNPIVEDLDGDSDVMFAGDMTEWIKFANTLKVRILTRYSDVATASYIQTELDAIAAEGTGFITADVAVNPGFLKEQWKQNYYWDEFGYDVGGTVRLTGDATCATQYVLDLLTTTGDPRISFIYEEPATGHKGVNQGQDNSSDEFQASLISNIGPGHLKSPTMDAVILTLAEHNFNMAELALEGFGGDPQMYYEAGVYASWAYLTSGSASDTIDWYLAQPLENVSYTVSTDKLEAIITQKWIAMNGITAEQSWFDYSRTGYPSNLPVSSRASTPDRPVRMAYPNSEVTGNLDNIPTQPNAFTAKIFWAN